ATTWLQWNARFRDDVRRFVRGEPGVIPSLMYRLYGSDDLFPDDCEHAYHPYQSVNYVTCHDGFTLYDLVAYNAKRNWANGHQNTDGPVDNYSWNCGWEGDEGVPGEVIELRKRQIKNFCVLLLLSNGHRCCEPAMSSCRRSAAITTRTTRTTKRRGSIGTDCNRTGTCFASSSKSSRFGRRTRRSAGADSGATIFSGTEWGRGPIYHPTRGVSGFICGGPRKVIAICTSWSTRTGSR